eukprot:m.44103 g.44103  ORF g.44103 m.44103 type:complete len:182 (+) comp10818_c0_seq3:207-752(+)
MQGLRKQSFANESRLSTTSRLFRSQLRTPDARPLSARSDASRAASELSYWTTKTGLSAKAVTQVHGVSTVAKQKQLRREKERQEHSDAQAERERRETKLLRVLIDSTRKKLRGRHAATCLRKYTSSTFTHCHIRTFHPKVLTTAVCCSLEFAMFFTIHALGHFCSRVSFLKPNRLSIISRV